MIDPSCVIYWDTSAVLSALVKDRHSRMAKTYAETDAVHFMSTLAYAEVCAVIARLEKDGILSSMVMQSVHELLDNGPWRRISVPPQWEITKDLSGKNRLRGADLWHLATA
jgi:predicted nucleic acid-binding protein